MRASLRSVEEDGDDLNTRHLVVQHKAQKHQQRRQTTRTAGDAVGWLLPRLESQLADIAECFGQRELSEDAFVKLIDPFVNSVSAGRAALEVDPLSCWAMPFGGDLRALLRHVFNCIDVRGNGKITWDQLLSFLITRGMKMSAAEEPAESERPIEFAPAKDLVGPAATRFEGVKRMWWARQLGGDLTGRVLMITRDSRLQILDPFSARPSEDRFDGLVSGVLTAVEHLPAHKQIVLAASGGELVFIDHCRVGDKIVGRAQADCTQTALKWSRKTERLFSGGRMGHLTQWKVCRGGAWEERCVQYHTGPVTAIVVFPLDGSIVTASLDSNIALLEPRHCRLIVRYEGHKAGVTSLDYSESQNMLVSGGLETEPLLWNVAAGSSVVPISLQDPDRPHIHPIVSVVAVPSAPQVVSVDAKGMVKLWDALTFRCMQTLLPWRQEGAQMVWERLTLSALWVPSQEPGQSSRLLVSSIGPMVQYEATESSSLEIRADAEPISALAYHAAGKTLVTAAGAGVRVWSVANGELVADHVGMVQGEISALCIDRSSRIVVGTTHGVVSAHDLGSGDTHHCFGAIHGAGEVICIHSMHHNACGLLVSVGADMNVCGISIDEQASTVVGRVMCQPRIVRAAPDTSWVAMAGGGRVELWDCSGDRATNWRCTGVIMLPRPKEEDPSSPIHFGASRIGSPDMEFERQPAVYMLTGTTASDVVCITFVPAHTALLVCDSTGGITLWSTRDPQKPQPIYTWKHTGVQPSTMPGAGAGKRAPAWTLTGELAMDTVSLSQPRGLGLAATPTHCCISTTTRPGEMSLVVADDHSKLTSYALEKLMARSGLRRGKDAPIRKLPAGMPPPRASASWGAHEDGVLAMLYLSDWGCLVTTGLDCQAFIWTRGGEKLGCLDQTGQSMETWAVADADSEHVMLAGSSSEVLGSLRDVGGTSQGPSFARINQVRQGLRTLVSMGALSTKASSVLSEHSASSPNKQKSPPSEEETDKATDADSPAPPPPSTARRASRFAVSMQGRGRLRRRVSSVAAAGASTPRLGTSPGLSGRPSIAGADRATDGPVKRDLETPSKMKRPSTILKDQPGRFRSPSMLSAAQPRRLAPSLSASSLQPLSPAPSGTQLSPSWNTPQWFGSAGTESSAASPSSAKLRQSLARMMTAQRLRIQHRAANEGVQQPQPSMERLPEKRLSIKPMPFAAAAKHFMHLSRILKEHESKWRPVSPGADGTTPDSSASSGSSPSLSSQKHRGARARLLAQLCSATLPERPPSAPPMQQHRWRPLSAAATAAACSSRGASPVVFASALPLQRVAAIQVAVAARRAKAAAVRKPANECPSGHAMTRVAEMPEEYVGRFEGVYCDICGARGLHLQAEYWHCAPCQMDICSQCAVDTLGVPPPAAAAPADAMRRRQPGVVHTRPFVPFCLRNLRHQQCGSSAGARARPSSSSSSTDRGPGFARAAGLHAVSIPVRAAAFALPLSNADRR
eukprot:TRINITY_DN4788_c0_g1_i1.p1 TRINITY_DN4788_c0_g1~~TRINITY_DN4788_c0_g1_i1.p1  ORF type:complete len:1508 (+),score=317.91 TRINITY_DN4788_c0_g1_i1:93-4526(+)